MYGIIFNILSLKPQISQSSYIPLHSGVDIWINPNQYVYMSYTLVRDSVRMQEHFLKKNVYMLAGVTH